MSKSNFKVLVKYYFFFFLFSAIYQVPYGITLNTGFVGLRDSVYFTFLWLAPIILFYKYAKNIAFIIGFILWLASLLNIGYYLTFSQEFSQSIIFIVMESNPSESIEFFEAYVKWWHVLIIILYTYISIVFWKALKPLNKPKNYNQLILPLVFIITFFGPFLQMYLSDHYSYDKSMHKFKNILERSSSPWSFIIGYQKYKQDLNNINKLLKEHKNIKKLSNLLDKYKDQNSTFILIIGESQNKSRMSLYGYERKTTPNLDAISDKLIAFNNVYTPRPYTIEALTQILTFADQKHPYIYLTQQNIITIMKQAGYETYWVTNQITQRADNTVITAFTKMADHQRYLNNSRRGRSISYDEKVLQPLKNILQQKSIKKKFIIVHLFGSHTVFKYRYPDSFNKFKTKIKNKHLTKSELESYNTYDNSIYYNDYIISQIIKLIQSDNNPAALLYFSDHGQEVYDDDKKHKMSRNEDNPTKAMYTVPYIIYGNNLWKKQTNVTNINLNKLYSSSDTIYTFLDIAGITFDGFDKTKSIVNKKFKQYSVLIGNPRKHLRDLTKKPFKN